MNLHNSIEGKITFGTNHKRLFTSTTQMLNFGINISPTLITMWENIIFNEKLLYPTVLFCSLKQQEFLRKYIEEYFSWKKLSQ